MRARHLLSFLFLTSLALLAGCTEDKVRALGANDLQCAPSQVHVVRGTGSYTAHGCGKWIEYDCIASRGHGETCFPHPRPDVHLDEESRN